MSESSNENHNELDIENDLKKLKLSLEHGLNFTDSFTSPDIPPAVEGQFLDYIQKWEDQYAQRKMTTVNDMVGRPFFRLINEIPDEEISASLDDIMALLNKHSVRIDTLCVVDDKELYRFVTEELLNVEIVDIQIDGMMHCFTYEEFHPNHAYDIRNRCSELIRHVADMEGDESIIPWGLAGQITYNGQTYARNDFNKHINRFRELFSSLMLTEFNYSSVTVNEAENEATAVALVQYSGITNDGHTMELNGNCIFNLRCEYEWWLIHQLTTPWKIIE